MIVYVSKSTIKILCMRKIYFVCPNTTHITGGVKQIYKQVEILNRNGISAYVLLEKKKQSNIWLTSYNIPIKYSPYLFKRLRYFFGDKKLNIKRKLKLYYLQRKSEKIDDSVILVFPEIYGIYIKDVFPDTPKVIFNQGCYMTFSGFSINKDYPVTPYNDKKTLGTIVASEDAFSYLSYTFKGSNIYRMILGIDNTIFNYSAEKRKQICFMPRKMEEDIIQVIHILKQRGKVQNWDFVSIDNKTEKEVSEIMKKSIFFLSFNRNEGFGLPAAEAMACGCYVIGYHGQGGKEYFKPEFSTIIEAGNIIEYVKEIEEKIALYEKDPFPFLEKGKRASQFILSNYSVEKEEESILKIWNKILSNT